MIQVGARNMQNFVLLTEVGKTRRPILLKRGMAASVNDLLMSAEYILSQGNSQVVLCERGIRGFDNATRNLYDVAAVPLAKRLSHLPIIVDPSHATGRPDLIPPCALAGWPLVRMASISKFMIAPKSPRAMGLRLYCRLSTTKSCRRCARLRLCSANIFPQFRSSYIENPVHRWQLENEHAARQQHRLGQGADRTFACEQVGGSGRVSTQRLPERRGSGAQGLGNRAGRAEHVS